MWGTNQQAKHHRCQKAPPHMSNFQHNNTTTGLQCCMIGFVTACPWRPEGGGAVQTRQNQHTTPPSPMALPLGDEWQPCGGLQQCCPCQRTSITTMLHSDEQPVTSGMLPSQAGLKRRLTFSGPGLAPGTAAQHRTAHKETMQGVTCAFISMVSVYLQLHSWSETPC